MNETTLHARLSEEHRRLLRRATNLERRMRTGPGPPPGRAARALAEALAGPFATHLQVEEEQVFPRLARLYPELSGTLERLRADHDELRALRADLAALIASAPDRARDERLGVVLGDLTDLMRLHFRTEEHAVFRWAARARARAHATPPHGARRRPRTP
jgi:hemerythrin-like domain-containing protein